MLEGIRSFYENASASVHVKRELSESFSVEVGMRQRCMMSPWLFTTYMDGTGRWNGEEKRKWNRKVK